MKGFIAVGFWCVVLTGLGSVLFVDGCAQSRAELDKYRPCAVAPNLPACLSEYDSSRFPEPIAEPESVDCRREVCA
jgi:hypothetical protein